MKSFFMPTPQKLMRYVLSICCGSFLLASCSKQGSVNLITPKPLPANSITSTQIKGGTLKGVMLADSTYYVSGDVTVLPNDSLLIQPGATIYIVNNSAFYIQGTIISGGTKDNPILFTSPTKKPGDWGGFQCDSAKVVTFKWTKIDWAGGPDSTGSPRQTITVSSPINVDIEDCWLLDGQDNGIGIMGPAKINILRNTIDGEGTTDGEGIDLHNGPTGAIAYNVIWGGAGSAIKVFTSTTLQIPQTNVDVYNNTVVDNGFRRGAAEPGRGILVDAFATARVYNNLIVNNYDGLDITPTADTATVKYGNNYFYATVDSLRHNYYPAGSFGKPQPSDIISSASTVDDPMFVNYSTNPPDPSLRINPDDFHLKPGSPALGRGNSQYNNDIGAYTSDGKGNQH